MYNDQIQKLRRRELRKNQTQAEKLLWTKLRNRQLNNLKFLRQYSVGPYILDFFCPQVRLNIELDGGQHKDQKEYDKERGFFIQCQDIKTLRFWNSDILYKTERILEIIRENAKNLLVISAQM